MNRYIYDKLPIILCQHRNKNLPPPLCQQKKVYLCIAKDAREIFEIADSQYFRVLVAVRCYPCKGVAIWVQQLCKTHNRVQQCPRHNTIIATTIAGNAERYGGGMPFDKAEIALGYTLLKP